MPFTIKALLSLAVLGVLAGSAIAAVATGQMSFPAPVYTFLGVEHIEFRSDRSRLERVEPSFDAIGRFFSDIAQEKGGVYAFELLRESTLPPSIDTHLMAHIVGDELYKQEQLEGMKYCTHDFRNACSHSIVIGALLNEGEGVFEDIHAICKQAPGAGSAYSMCFHGFGHGVLAFSEYELPEAVEMCEQLGTESYNNYEFDECVGGVIMEMRGGIHDPDVWAEKAKKYIVPADPLKLCEYNFITDDVSEICYIYATPFMLDAVGAADIPTARDIDRAFDYCEPVTDAQDRNACYAGFGKEFVTLIHGRDVRKVEVTPDEKLQDIVDWCHLADDTNGTTSCLLNALGSLFWGGENHYSLSTRFCALLDGPDRDACYSDTIHNMVSYTTPDDDTYRRSFCTSLPEEYQGECSADLIPHASDS